MTKEDNIIVPRLFLEVVEDTLRIQNNINLDKKTGENCQDRNVKESLNGLRKLLRGEELTGLERLERLQPSLTSGLDEAAEEGVRPIMRTTDKAHEYLYTYLLDAFKAGAKLMNSELFEKLKITPLKVICKDEYGYPVYDFEVGHYYRTFTLFGEKYKCDQTDSGKAGEQMLAGQGFSFEDEVIFDGKIPFLKNADFYLLDSMVHFIEGDKVIVQIRKKE